MEEVYKMEKRTKWKIFSWIIIAGEQPVRSCRWWNKKIQRRLLSMKSFWKIYLCRPAAVVVFPSTIFEDQNVFLDVESFAPKSEELETYLLILDGLKRGKISIESTPDIFDRNWRIQHDNYSSNGFYSMNLSGWSAGKKVLRMKQYSAMEKIGKQHSTTNKMWNNFY